MSKDYSNDLYFLDKSSKKYICPSCGKKTFTPYVNDRGEILDDSCGRCDRDNSCGYHLKWRDFFKEHPEKETDEFKQLRVSYLQGRDYAQIQEPQPSKKICYISPDKARLDRATNDKECNALYHGLIKKYPDFVSRIDAAFEQYKITTSRHWVVNGYKATAYPQIDSDGRIHQIKVIAYNPETAKRLKHDETAELYLDKHGSYVPDTRGLDKTWFVGKSLMGDDKEFEQTFFGAHLIKESDKPIIIVEGEKAAVIGSVFLDNYTWIATGGKQQIRLHEPGVCSLFHEKKVFLFPDRDAEDRWREYYAAMQANGVNVGFIFDYPDNLPDNADIADYIDYIIDYPF